MKVRKILFGMTAGMMAVSSAIVCQVWQERWTQRCTAILR